MVEWNSKQLHIAFKWFPVFLVPLLIVAVLGLCYRFLCRRRAHERSATKKDLFLSNMKDAKSSQQTHSKATPANAAGESVTKRDPLSTNKLNSQSRPTSAATLTNTDIAHLDRIIRTASDRSLWKLDDSAKKPRKVPSGLLHPQSSFL